jgi:ribonuclease P protein component
LDFVNVSVIAPNGCINLPNSSAAGKKFPRSVRLLRHLDFERVYKQGQRHFARHMTVFFLSRPQGKGLQIGFTVGRMLGGAVERNRIKRRLREAVRLDCPTEFLPVDVVINPKKAVLTADFGGLRNEVRGAFAAISRALKK